MNLVDPEAIAAALKPILDRFETNVVDGINEAVNSAIDRLHGIKITVEVDVPPRATKADNVVT
jgi:hypothetical protein